MDCFFCGIINGAISTRKVYEDDFTLAFMDTAGDVDGHMLVVPKKHCESILDCDEETLAQLMRSVKRVSDALVEKCGYSGVNLLNASGEGSGQSVPHFHIHIIPRKPSDGIDTWFDFKGAEHDIDEVYNSIVSAMNAESMLGFEVYSPTDESRSCVVRTLTKLTGKDHSEVKKELTSLAEQMGLPTYNDADTRVKELRLGRGEYCVVATNNAGFFHMFPVIDGVIYDRRNDSQELCVVSVYKKQ